MNKRIYLSALLGVFLEYFDYALYGFSALYIAEAFFPPEKHAVALMLSWAVFGVSFLVRPIGAVIFGHFADRFGRRKILMLTITLMSIATIAMGLLPSYARVGLLAPITLLLCRILQGIAVSTEYSGCSTYLMEFYQRKHGLISGIITSASGIGVFAASGLFLILGSHWRAAFVLAGFIVGVLGMYCRAALTESPAFLQIQKQEKIATIPFLQLLKTSPTATIRGILISAYVGIAIMAIEVYLPTYLQTQFSISKTHALELSTYLALIEAGFAIAWGWISDKIGQAKTLMLGGALMLIGILPILFLFKSVAILLWILAATLLAILVGSVDGPIAAFLADSFPTQTRYTGVSVCYNVGAALIGGFSPALMIFLQSKTTLPVFQIYLMGSAVLCLLVFSFTRNPTSTSEN